MGVADRRVYPDTCILIYLVEDRAHWAQTIRQRLEPVLEPVPELVFSELTRLECRVQPLKTGNMLALQVFDQFFATRGYRYQAMDRKVFDLATQLRAQHSLKTPDALHLAAAISAGCDEFWTNDQRLTKAAQSKLRIVTFESTQ